MSGQTVSKQFIFNEKIDAESLFSLYADDLAAGARREAAERSGSGCVVIVPRTGGKADGAEIGEGLDRENDIRSALRGGHYRAHVGAKQVLKGGNRADRRLRLPGADQPCCIARSSVEERLVGEHEP